MMMIEGTHAMEDWVLDTVCFGSNWKCFSERIEELWLVKLRGKADSFGGFEIEETGRRILP